MAVSRTLTQAGAQTNSNNITGVAFSTASAERIIVCVLHFENATNPATATIGGVSATLAATADHTGDNVVQIWYAVVPTGTSGTFAGNVNVGACGLSVYAVYGADPTHTDSGQTTSTATSISLATVTVPTDGLGIWGWTNDTDAVCAWTNAAEDSDYLADANRCSTASTLTAGTPTVTADGANDDQALAGVAFGPLAVAAVPIYLNMPPMQPPMRKAA